MSDLLLHRGKRRSREEGLSGVASQASSWGWSCPRAVLSSQGHPLFRRSSPTLLSALGTLPISPHQTLTTLYVMGITIPISQMRNLRPREGT